MLSPRQLSNGLLANFQRRPGSNDAAPADITVNLDL